MKIEEYYEYNLNDLLIRNTYTNFIREISR